MNKFTRPTVGGYSDGKRWKNEQSKRVCGKVERRFERKMRTIKGV